MTRYRNKIHAKIPEPNDNVTMTMGNKTVVDAVFADTGLEVFLDGPMRDVFSAGHKVGKVLADAAYDSKAVWNEYTARGIDVAINIRSS